MSFDIVIGGDAQPASFDIVIGDSGGGGSMLDIEVPTASLGTVLLILVVRNGAITCSDATWTQVINGEGASGLFLDGWVRTVDGTAGSNAGNVISFLSVTEQELQGTLIKSTNADAASLVYDVEHGAFAADATPPAPSISATQDFDTVACVWSMADAITVSVPSGMTELDSYTSSVVSERTFLVGQLTAGSVGSIPPGDAAASPAAIGRAFSIALHHLAEPPGATLTAMGLGSISSKWVAAIEGYGNLLTDAATDIAITAWDGTGYTSALGGLYVRCNHEQRIEPWNSFANTGGRLTLQVVQSESGDTFGVDTHIKSGGQATQIEDSPNGSIDCDDTTVNVKSAAAFAESGTLYIGTEACSYTGTTATSFTGLTRGKFSPFLTDSAANFAHPHQIAEESSVPLLPVVSSTPRSWHGKWIGLWRHLHDAANGLLNVKADALCTFAGRIVEIRDNPETMTTDVEVQHVLEWIQDAVIGENPWTATLVDAIELRENQQFRASELKLDGTSAVSGTADPLNVIAAGGTPASNYEVPAGRYTLTAVMGYINAWLDQALTDTDLTVDMKVAYSAGPDGATHSKWRCKVPATGGDIVWRLRLSLPSSIALALGGFADEPDGFDNRLIERAQVDQTKHYVSLGPALRFSGLSADVTDELGEFYDQTNAIPASLGSFANSLVGSGEIAICTVSGLDPDLLVLVKKDGTEIEHMKVFHKTTGNLAVPQPLRIPYDAQDKIKIQQVVILQGTYASLMLQIFASSGTAGFNHATYDTLPSTHSLGIPWELLGDQFEQSIQLFDHADTEITLVFNKAWKVVDLLGGAFNLRFAFLRWINGGLQFWTWMTPTTGDALEEDNKASPAGNRDEQRSVSRLSDEWARNLIKIDYNRDFSLSEQSAFRAHDTIIDRAAIDDAGGKKSTRTIEDHTSYAPGFLGGTGTIDELLTSFRSIVPMFTRPVRTTRRTIAPTFFEGYSVGDTVLVTDNYARDPDTGARSVATRPGIIVAHSYEPGGFSPDGSVGDMHGEVEIMFLDNLKIGPYVPAANVASYDGTDTVTLDAHAYSLSGEAVDASYMTAGRKVRMVERDPEDPAAPLSWDRIVDSVSGNDVTFTVGLSSPAYDAGLSYRLIWDDYSDVVAAQQAYSFQADDADFLVSDARAPYQYVANTSLKDLGDGLLPTGDDNSASDAVELPPDSSYGDGVGLDIGTQVATSRLITNLFDYKTARSNPVLLRSPLTVLGDTTHEWQTVMLFPIFLTSDILSNTVKRKLYVAPHWKSTSGALCNARITLMRNLPSGAGPLPYESTFPAPYVQTSTFTTTSTSFATPTEVALDIGSVKDFFGVAYVALEMQVPTASGSEIASAYGISVCYEGPRVYP